VNSLRNQALGEVATDLLRKFKRGDRDGKKIGSVQKYAFENPGVETKEEK
jgi:hypothetical protein